MTAAVGGQWSLQGGLVTLQRVAKNFNAMEEKNSCVYDLP